MVLLAALMLILTGMATIALASFLLSLPVYLLWNGCLVGAINGVNEVSWLQAWGLAILCGFLFKQTGNINTKD